MLSMSVAGSVVSPGDEFTLLPGILSHKVEGVLENLWRKFL